MVIDLPRFIAAGRPITTRRYFSGTHRVELLVNGRAEAEASFDLRA